MTKLLYHKRIEYQCPKTQTPATLGIIMDGEESFDSAYASSSNDSELDRAKGLDFDTGFRHILALLFLVW